MDRTHAESCKASSEEKLISSLPMEFQVFLKHLKKLNYNHKPGIVNVNKLPIHFSFLNFIEPFKWN